MAAFAASSSLHIVLFPSGPCQPVVDIEGYRTNIHVSSMARWLEDNTEEYAGAGNVILVSVKALIHGTCYNGLSTASTDEICFFFGFHPTERRDKLKECRNGCGLI
jgi:hypothetical protein